MEEIEKESILETIAYYFICFVGIIFGIWAIKCFKKVMGKELVVGDKFAERDDRKGNKSLIISYI